MNQKTFTCASGIFYKKTTRVDVIPPESLDHNQLAKIWDRPAYAAIGQSLHLKRILQAQLQLPHGNISCG